MAWYKFTARHGGGHRSTTVEYCWFDSDWDKVPRREMWEDWVDAKRIGSYDHSVRGEVTRVTKLPEDEKEKLRRRYLRQIADAQDMLRVIDGTEVLKR